jgi:hypothetical protein
MYLRVSPGSSLVVSGQGLGREQRGCPFTTHLSFHSYTHTQIYMRI